MGLLFIDANVPFTVALALVVLLVGLELLGLVLGLSPSNALDELLPFDLEGVAPSGWLSWAGMNLVPSYLWFLILLSCFGGLGIGFNLLATRVGDGSLPWFLSIGPVLLAALGLTSTGARLAARILPQEESSALDVSDFEGQIVQVRMGLAISGQAAEASFVDAHGQRHYLMVEPIEAEEVFGAGDSVLLVKKAEGAWLGVRH